MPDRPTRDTPHTSIEPEAGGKRLHAAFALALNTHLADDERGVGIADDWDALPRQDQEAWIEVVALAEQDLPALSLGRKQVAKLEEIAKTLTGAMGDRFAKSERAADAAFLRDLAKNLGDGGQGERIVLWRCPHTDCKGATEFETGPGLCHFISVHSEPVEKVELEVVSVLGPTMEEEVDSHLGVHDGPPPAPVNGLAAGANGLTQPVPSCLSEEGPEAERVESCGMGMGLNKPKAEDNPYDESVGRLLRLERLSQGLTLRQVEARTGVPNPHVSQIETGTIKKPSAEHLWRLADLYGLPKRDVLELGGHLDNPVVAAALSASSDTGGAGEELREILMAEATELRRFKQRASGEKKAGESFARGKAEGLQIGIDTLERLAGDRSGRRDQLERLLTRIETVRGTGPGYGGPALQVLFDLADEIAATSPQQPVPDSGEGTKRQQVLEDAKPLIAHALLNPEQFVERRSVPDLPEGQDEPDEETNYFPEADCSFYMHAIVTALGIDGEPDPPGEVLGREGGDRA